MAGVIHRAPQLQKCLSKLRKAGGRGTLAAERVDTILAALTTQAGIRPEAVYKLTRHGEARIEHCKKVDLVGGYRLVYIQEGQHYYFLYAGTHDDCDRWLTHNRDLKLVSAAASRTVETLKPVNVAPASTPEASACEPDYDALMFKDLDDNMLRRVFRGLCGA